MGSRRIGHLAGVVWTASLMVGAQAFAAEIETNNYQTTCSNCVAEADWNPTLSCDSSPLNAYELMTCLIGGGSPGCDVIEEPQGQQSINGSESELHYLEEVEPRGGEEDCVIVHHETGNYRVSLLGSPRVGLEILKEDFSEIGRLTFRENYPELTTVEVWVEQDDLRARIDLFDAYPSDGEIIITLNEREEPVSLDTGNYADPASMALDLVTLLRRSGFSASYTDREISVSWDEVEDRGITRVRVESTDPNLVRSEVALEPRGTFILGPPGGTF